MTLSLASRNLLRSVRLSALTVAFAAAACLPGAPARAGRSTFRTYNANQGLSSLGGGCITQDRSGFVLVCTESGVFAYDGRRFDNLGTDQGLRQGGDVYDVAVAASGRVAVRFADEVLVSDRATDASHAPRSLSFQTVAHPGLNFYDETLHRLVAWQDGLVLLAGDAVERIVFPADGAPRIEVMGYDPVERAMLASPMSVFSITGHLWTSLADGRLCTADPGHVRCYGVADGLRGGEWVDVVAGDGGRVLARSATSVATLDPASGAWSVVSLPDQGGRYRSYVSNLGLFRTPDGGLVTQADHGLAVLGAQGWRTLSVEEGAPSGTIVSAMTDATGQLWFQVFGLGLKRWVGYGRWETFQKSDGLSDGVAWATARAPGGPLWIATDTGIDEVVRRGSALKLSRVFPEASYALAAGPHGRLWCSNGNEGAMVIDPVTGSATRIGTPAVGAIFAGVDDVWLGTRSGLFKVDDRPGKPLGAQLAASARTEIVDVTGDGSGGVYYLSSGRLRHHHQDGVDRPILEQWPIKGFEPLSLALDHNGALWVGGSGGLFRFAFAADKMVASLSVPTSDTLSNSIVAVMVDHRGWVWVGTSRGLSVSNGQRWVSLDIDSGLVANDIDEGGLREDPDGSVWITTVEGLSHLLDPRWLFDRHPAQVLVSGATLGSRPVTGRMPYSREALTVQFGTPSYGAEGSVVFRYRLSGVDASEVQSSSGLVHYPFVPPGRHVLTVTGYDEMTHDTSAPASFVIDVAYPWWKQWWAVALWGAAALGLIYAAMWLRLRAVMARQAELQRHVAKATELLRYDGLTGLLNRREIERHLADKLSIGRGESEMVIALLDIDHFKQVNDLYGHLGGDDVLRALGRLALADIWQGECAGRYGGEEFLLVLDDSDGRGADRVLQLLHTIRGTPFNAAGASIRVTCSIGLAWAVGGDDWETLIGRADQALYEAKDAGRDRVVERGRRGVSAQPRHGERRMKPLRPERFEPREGFGGLTRPT